MKKLFSCLFFILFFVGIFSLSNDTQKVSAADCRIISNKYTTGENAGYVSDITVSPNEGNIKLSTPDQKVIITGTLKLTKECFTDGKTARKFKAFLSTNNGFKQSEVLNPQYESFSITAQLGVDACVEDNKQYKCIVVLQFSEVDGNGNNKGEVLLFKPLNFTISFATPTLIDTFKKTVTLVSWNGTGIVPNKGDCARTSHTANAYIGNQIAPEYTYTLDAGGNMPANSFIQYDFNVENCTGKNLTVNTYLFSPDFQNINQIFGVADNDKLPIVKKAITITQNNNYVRITPPPFNQINIGSFYDTIICRERSRDSKYITYECAIVFDISQDSFSTSFWKILTYNYKVKVPLALENKVIIKANIESNLETGSGVNLGQFGSTGIKEGFSWDPCYDPKSQKQVTYLGKTSDGGVDVSDIGKSTPLSDPKVTPVTAECYTLLSNLPIKLQGTTDKISQQIGYAPARGQDNQIIPGLVKTVIVGNFFIGDFILYLFRLLVGVVGLVAVAVLIYIGIAIATSKENPYKLKELKAWLGRVFGGIAIILASYLVLSIIDPKLTDFGFGTGSGFNLSEQGFPTTYTSESTYVEALSNYQKSSSYKKPYGLTYDGRCGVSGLGDSGTSGDLTAKNKLVTSQNTANMTKIEPPAHMSNGESYLQTDFALKVIQFLNDPIIKKYGNTVTEAFPPTSFQHASGCHYIGRTIDYDVKNLTPTEMREIQDTAAKYRLVAVYEVPGVDIGPFRSAAVSDDMALNYGTGSHFSIYDGN